jgi:acetyl-CoA carboxylase biotin carboxyl carrier protein
MPAKNPRKEAMAEALGLDDVREILDLLEARGISEFELEKNGFRVRIKREPAHEPSSHHVTFTHPGAHAVVVGPPGMTATVETASSPAEPAPAEPPAAEPSEGLYIIKSPIVGTFYSAPGPDTPPFVKIGDTVRAGQVLCIIEAMKLMNEIQAEIAGEITRIFVENGQPVEYGQELFGILPAESHPANPA